MITASALFKRHARDFEGILGANQKQYGASYRGEDLIAIALIYSACILAEAIRNDEPVEMKVCPKCAQAEQEKELPT